MLTDHGSITDVPGIWVGHHQRSSRGWRTGATVVFAPEGAVAGVDVRGGGPGTRETDALVPWNLVDRINAVCLTGGSAYGLAAADGVMDYLAEQDLGFRVGPDKGEVVPVVPTAVIFDLGRGGSFASRPDAGFGYRAAAAASAKERRRGSVGAGMGAVAGGLRGGIGMASSKVVFTVDGTHDVAVTVGALCVVNARGSLIDATTGLPHHRTPGLRRPSADDRRALSAHLNCLDAPALNTTLAVVATVARIDRAESTRIAMAGHDGLSRAIKPVHTLADGDTVFSLATGRVELDDAERIAQLSEIHAVAADCVASACVDAIIAASPTRDRPTYLSLCPSAVS